jgi:hypothetical protein
MKITLNNKTTIDIIPIYETTNFAIHTPINNEDSKYVVTLKHDKKPIVVRLNNLKVAKRLTNYLERYELGIYYSDIAQDKEALSKFKLLLIDFLHDTRSPFIIGNTKYNQ